MSSVLYSMLSGRQPGGMGRTPLGLRRSLVVAKALDYNEVMKAATSLSRNVMCVMTVAGGFAAVGAVAYPFYDTVLSERSR